MTLIRRLRTGMQAYVEDARVALRTAPVEVVLGLATAATLSWAIEADGIEEWSRIAFGVLLAFPLIFTTSALAAAGALAPARRWALVGATLLAATLYSVLQFDHRLPAELWRAAMLGVAALLVPTLVPVIARARQISVRERFWLYNTRLVLRLATAYGFALALMLGLWAAVGSVQQLFDVQIDEKVYAHIASLLLFGMAPWALTGGIPGLVREGAGTAEQALVNARRIGLYLLLPLLAVYVAILYAYTVRIVFVTELPRNLVSPLVLAAGAMWLVGAVVLEPFNWLDRPTGVTRVVRALPLILLPLVVLGAWAIALRIQQYGWTEFRYVRLAALAALGILAVIGFMRLLRREAPPLFSIPIVFIALLLPAALGPLSAPAVAKRSQRALLAQELRAAGFDALPATLGVEATRATRTVPAATYRRISGAANYLRQNFGAPGVAGLLTGDTSALRHGDVAARLGLTSTPDGSERVMLNAQLAPAAGIPLPSGGTLYPIDVGGIGRGSTTRGASGPIAVQLQGDGTQLLVTVPGQPPLRAELGDLIAKLETRARMNRSHRAGAPDGVHMVHLDAQLSAAEAVVALVDAGGQERGHLVIRSVNFGRGPDPFRAEARAPAAAAARTATDTTSWAIDWLSGFVVVPTGP